MTNTAAKVFLLQCYKDKTKSKNLLCYYTKLEIIKLSLTDCQTLYTRLCSQMCSF